MVIEMKVFGKVNAQVLCMGSMSRLFYKLSINPLYFPSHIQKMLSVKIIRSSSLSCAYDCSHFYL